MGFLPPPLTPFRQGSCEAIVSTQAQESVEEVHEKGMSALFPSLDILVQSVHNICRRHAYVRNVSALVYSEYTAS